MSAHASQAFSTSTVDLAYPLCPFRIYILHFTAAAWFLLYLGYQSTRHTVNFSQPKIVDELTGGWNTVLWRVDRRLKRRAVTAVTS